MGQFWEVGPRFGPISGPASGPVLMDPGFFGHVLAAFGPFQAYLGPVVRAFSVHLGPVLGCSILFKGHGREDLISQYPDFEKLLSAHRKPFWMNQYPNIPVS